MARFKSAPPRSGTPDSMKSHFSIKELAAVASEESEAMANSKQPSNISHI